MVKIHLIEGGDGSGNFGHRGRPGEVGGSSSRMSAVEIWSIGNQEEIQSQEKQNPMGNYAKEFNDFLDTQPKINRIVYRGLNGDSSHLERYLKEGDVVTFDNSISASLDKEIARDFAITPYGSKDKSMILRIRVKTAVDISNFVTDDNKYQKEAILRKGSRYRIDTVMPNSFDVDYFVVMEEI